MFHSTIVKPLLVVVFACSALHAQTAKQSRLLGLDDALALAFQTSEYLRVAQSNLVRAEATQSEARSDYFPQLSGIITYTRTHESEFNGIGLPFGQKNKYQLGLSASQLVFSGGRLSAGNRIAAAGHRIALLDLASAAAQITLDVTRAYFAAALGDRVVDISAATLAQAETAFVHAKAAHRVGNQSEFEVLRAQVARDNEHALLIQHRVDRELAHLRLKKLLNIQGSEQLTLTTALDAETGDIVTAQYASDIPEILFDVRAPVQQAAENVRIAEDQLRVAQAALLPTLSVVSEWGRVTYPLDGAPLWRDSRSNWFTGVALRFPLFQGGRLRSSIAAADAGLAVARAQHEQIRDFAEIDTRAAVERLAAAKAGFQATIGTVEQASRAYAIAEVRYREGISTQLELADARLLLQQAQINRARAAADVRVAEARVKLIHELPLEQ